MDDGIRSDLRDIKERLASIELVLARQEGQDLHRRLERAEERIGSLERWRAWLTGGIALASSGVVLLAVKVMVGE